MSSEDSHNHFCIYCGEKLIPNQQFCSKCGREIYHGESADFHKPSKYDDRILEIERDYNFKQSKALDFVKKIFNPSDMAYEKFASAINRSNKLFNNQLMVTRKMVELDSDENELVEREIEGKIKTLQTFVDKMDELINELVIHLSSNKKDDDEINDLFSDMDDLINSVKNY